MNGTYGTTKPAKINIDTDVQIFYNFKPNRAYSNVSTFQELDVNNLLNTVDPLGNKIDGLYNLRLPLDIFGDKGVYTVYIKPKEIHTKIYTVGTLQEFPDIRGVIFRIADGLSNFTNTNALAGYRIDYEGYSRIITSSNLCNLVIVNGQNKYTLYVNNGSMTSSNANYIFCTVTPSAANSHTPTAPPPIGSADEAVKIVNTKFNPVMFEIDMIEHDAETLSYMLEGDQVRNLENGTFTIYNHDKEIYKQYNTYTVKTKLGRPLYDIKEQREDINTNESYENTIGLE
jgi:hypothetical protein